MPRKPREKSKTGMYHVVVVGSGQRDIFHEEDDFQKYLETARKVSAESGVKVLGYCIMNNHAHLLLQENNGDVSLYMKRLGIVYAYWYNQKYERTGHVFQDRFRSECIEDNAYLLTVLRYIHQDPVKALMVKKPEEYEWSSCAAFYQADSNVPAFPDTGYILGIIHKDKKRAMEILKKFMEEKTEDRCLDCHETSRISESKAYEIAKKIMNGKPATDLQAMDVDVRNDILRRLREEGLSLRQISKITGLPFHVVRKV